MNTFRDRADPSRTRPSPGVYESRVKHLEVDLAGRGLRHVLHAGVCRRRRGAGG